MQTILAGHGVGETVLTCTEASSGDDKSVYLMADLCRKVQESSSLKSGGHST